MKYVYILQCVAEPDRFYTGLCKDVEARLAAFERYLKSGSGRAFAQKRLR